MRRLGRQPARVVALLAVVGMLVSGCGISLESMPKLGSSAGAGYDIHTTFGNVLNLAVGAQVRDSDALVGRVTTISTTNYQAHVTLHIERSVHLPTGTTATVEFNTPLGDEYVQLQPPSRPAGSYILAGATIGPPDTTNAPSVEDLLAAVAAVLYGGGLSQAHTVVSELNQILGNNQPQIRQLLSDVNSAVGNLSAQTGDLDNALTAVAKVSAELNGGSSAMVAALNTLPAAARSLSQNNDGLRSLLDALNHLSPVVVGVVQQSGADLLADAHQLLPVVQQLVAAKGEVASGFSSATSFLANVARIIPNGYAQVNSDLEGVLPAGYPTQIPPVVPTPSTLVHQITSGAALQELINNVLP